MANLGFDGIAKILTPALEVLYPGLIVLCVAKIGAKSGVLNRITGR
jgi:branched-subunit amino acid permease